MEKYKINELLLKLPKQQYDFALRELPQIMGITRRTFNRWRNYQTEDKAQIPADKLYILARYLEVSMEDLFYRKPKPIPKVKTKREALARKYGLTLSR